MTIKAAVIGAGAWGTTLSLLLAEQGTKTALWSFEDEVVADINRFRENKKFLEGFTIPETITAGTDINEAINGSNLIIFVVPTQHLKSVLKKIEAIPKEALLLSASKGIEISSLKRPSQIIEEHFKKEIAVLSGPNLAREIALGLPSASVVSAKNNERAVKIQNMLMSERFRIYTQDDVTGVELGGALKNIIAIASGIVDGLSLGENARAGLMVRGINEISRLGTALGANPKTFYGLSGIGDLILTCSSKSSRNHQVGVEISRGKGIKEITGGTRQIAEGVDTTRAAVKLASELKIELPITSEVYSILFENKDPHSAVSDLFGRKAKKED